MWFSKDLIGSFVLSSRLKPGCKLELEDIEAEIKCKLEEVSWLPDFYYLPPDVRIASTKAYQEGKVTIEF